MGLLLTFQNIVHYLSFFCRMLLHVSHSFPLSPTVQCSPKLLRTPIEISESLQVAENLPLETWSNSRPSWYTGLICYPTYFHFKKNQISVKSLSRHQRHPLPFCSNVFPSNPLVFNKKHLPYSHKRHQETSSQHPDHFAG